MLPLLFTLPLLIAASGALAHSSAHSPAERSPAELKEVLRTNSEPVGGPFALIDQAARPRTDKDFRGKLMLVYFGYSYCADVCPMDLQQIGMAVQSLGAAGDAVQPLFITLDPARDTRERLAVYAPAFHPRLVGLGGSDAAVRKAADAYRVHFKKVKLKNGDYAIDHAANIYLMDRGGKYLGFFPAGTSAARMAEVIRQHL